jgi:small nuclear ribonucleoprotein (snRNP)-like protein
MCSKCILTRGSCSKSPAELQQLYKSRQGTSNGQGILYGLWQHTACEFFAPTHCLVLLALLLLLLQVTVELKNDLAITGTLHSVDQYLNIKLTNTHVQNEGKYPHMVSLPLDSFTSGQCVAACAELCVRSVV